MDTYFLPVPRAEFEALLSAIRPELHRYVSRMIGSSIDAEDVVQEALVKADSAFALLTSTTNLRGWLFRIAHNKAVDYLRKYKNEATDLLDELPAIEPDIPLEDKELAAIALSAFVKLAPRQRSCVILKDIFDYSLAEISEFLDASVPEIKAALHRGRTRLRELSKSVNILPQTLSDHERDLLLRYIDRFNARDFDAVRAMLADEVHVELVGRSLRPVKESYFHNYAQSSDWRLAPGLVEGQAAVLVFDLQQPENRYFMLLRWDQDRIVSIRDYRYARYVAQEAELITL